MKMKSVSLRSFTGWGIVWLLSGLVAMADVKDVAWLQGDSLDNGTRNLAAPESAPLTLLWNRTSSLDGQVFEHSLGDPASVRLLKDGDYFFAFTAPIRLTSEAERTASVFQVYVNGEAVPGALGQSTLIRNGPLHNQSSGHFQVFVPGLSTGDEIMIKTHRMAVPLGATELELASLLIERVDQSETVFSALATETSGGSDINRPNGAPNTELVWHSNRRDEGVNHSDGQSRVSLSGGRYWVYVNMPVSSLIERASPGIRVILDGAQVKNGLAEQGYVRNASGHMESSVHWSGLITVNGTQSLGVATLQRAAPGLASIPPGKPATLLVRKISASTELFTSAIFDPFFDFNLPNPTFLKWNDPSEGFDAETFSHVRGESDIEVLRNGSYFLVYNDDLAGSVIRANPIVKVLVNGHPIPGAEVKSHYMRNFSGHGTSSGTLAFLLEDLKAGDRISMTSQQEEASGVVLGVRGDALAILSLVKMKDAIVNPDLALPPRLQFFEGNLFGFEAHLIDRSTSVDTRSIRVFVDGKPIAVLTSKVDGKTRIRFEDLSFPSSGSVRKVVVTFLDSKGISRSEAVNYTIQETFTRVGALDAVADVDLKQEGFRVRTTQIVSFTGNAGAHGNTLAGAELQLSGIHPQTGQTYINQANPESHVGVTLINWEQGGGDVPGENFGSVSGFPNQEIPGIPGLTGSSDGVVAEILAFLELQPGFHTLGVNSDEGFKLTMGRSPKDLQAPIVGSWSGARSASDTLFNVVVEEAGWYPVRLIWFEGSGAANLEFFSVKDGEKILVNDRSHPRAIKAYSTGPILPYAYSVEIPDGTLGSEVRLRLNEGTSGIADEGLMITLDGEFVAPAVVRNAGLVELSFDNGRPFSAGVHEVVFFYRENGLSAFPREFRIAFESPWVVQEIFRDHPIAYWNLGETEGDIAYSQQGEGFNGTYFSSNESQQPGLAAGRIATGSPSFAVRLNKDYQNLVKIPDQSNLNIGGPWEERTVELWFKADRLPRSMGGILGSGSPERQVLYEEGGAEGGLCIYLSGTRNGEQPEEADLWFLAWNRSAPVWGDIPDPALNLGSVPLAVRTNIRRDTIYQAVLVMNGDSGGLRGSLAGYVNGKLVGRLTGVGVLNQHPGGIGIGGMSEAVGFHDRIVDPSLIPDLPEELFWFDGILDDVAVFSSALSAERISAHYLAGMTPVPFQAVGNFPVGPFTSIRLTNGQLEMVWDGGGILQSAPSVQGPYTDVMNASSPYRTPLLQGVNRFFRLRK